MSGHSKWSTIKHKKAATDAKKGKAWSAASKAITVAAREGASGDPDRNAALRLAIEKARAVNMPSDNIKRAIDRGLGVGEEAGQEIVYEGYGQGGVGFMVIAETSNRNRTGAEMKNMFEKFGGSLGAPGSAAYLFEREGGEVSVKVPLPVTDKQVRDKVQQLVQALEDHQDVQSVYTNLG